MKTLDGARTKFVAMDTAFLLVHRARLLLVIMAFLVSTNITNSVATNPRSIVTKLIHRDSILSPFFNASATIKDRANRELELSTARLAYLKAATMVKSPDDIRGDIIADARGVVFLVNMSIGEPPVPQLLVLDTASRVLWVHCSPCTGCQTDNPLFDPSKSSTYFPWPCNHSPYCESHCDTGENHCTFSVSYKGGSYIAGNIATEKLTFVTSDEGSVDVPNIVFGCGHEFQHPHPSNQVSGYMGLDAGDGSLIHQVGNKFSYCIGNISDTNYIYNRLILGDGAVIEGDSTSLEIYNGFYYLTLEGISVGDKRLGIDPKVFQRSSEGGGVMIDSGTTVTFLARGAFEPLRSEVENIIGGSLRRVRATGNPDWLCYRGIAARDLGGFPVVTFHFGGGADLELNVENMFQNNMEQVFCLAVGVADGNSPSVIGVYAQQYLNIAYDLSAWTLSFERTDCQTLEDRLV
ncbi:hypothetical protein RJ640_026515 [Escallonia rubra]|uniref:Peptidase A1 domain-containing protein n=1 Tax=Escallonia rubra TaxID=112253 RepID=A0AA88QCP9_9ASTE|nr:hypothetical protein RJ640_026515 [Escallonia rubra]